MKTIPIRKRTSLASRREKEYYLRNHPEFIEDINSGKYFEEEVNIPALYRLEKKVIMELLQKIDLSEGISYVLKKSSIILMMKKFLTYVDELNSICQPYSPCKKGCSLCCDMPVAISDLEAVIIKEYLDKNRINYHRLNPMGKKQKNGAKNGSGSIGEEYSGVKCPFLKDNLCSIYSARPFVCRKYIAIGACNIKQTTSRIIGEGYIIGMTYDKMVLHHIRKNLHRYALILDPIQIEVTEEEDLNGVHNLDVWQKYSDIRDNFSGIHFT